MDAQDTNLAEQLKEFLKERREGSRFPKDLKERLVCYVRGQHEQGKTLRELGEELGVDAWKLSIWTREGRRKALAEFQEVGVVNLQEGGATRADSGSAATVARSPRPMRLALTSPSGWRIEGLDLEGAIELMMRCSC